MNINKVMFVTFAPKQDDSNTPPIYAFADNIMKIAS